MSMPVPPFSLLHRNDDFVVLNKAPGISLQREDDQPGLLALAAAQLGIEHLRPVHRLDKMTSGVVVMARTLAANRELARQFAAREVEKFYLAVSDQKPKKKQGMVRGGMMKARRSAWKLTTGSDNLAITQFFSSSVRPGLRLFVLRPLTGKTHQIRVAMKAVGAPILGDVLYGGGGADRGYLHAWSLALNWAGERHCYRCLPEQGSHFLAEDFLQALVQLGAPEQLAWPAVAVPPVTGTGADPDDYS